MINASENRFPFCIVWTLLPCISWFLPWIGHVGICDSNGLIYDFLGYHINKKTMAFGNPIKYVILYPDSTDQYDQAVQESNTNFSQQPHDLCCNNCHHHVAQALNLMKYEGRQDWTQFSVWWMCLSRSNYVSKCSVLKVYLPLVIMLSVVITLAVTLH